MPSDPQSVIARNGNILRECKTALTDHVDAAESGKVVGIKNTCRRLLQIEQLLGHLRRTFRASVRRFEHIFVGDVEPELLRCPVEGRKTAVRNRRVKTVNIRNPAVAALVNISQKIAHSVDIVGNDRSSVVKNMVDRDERDIAVHKLRNIRIVEIHACHDHSVKAAVSAVIEIRHPAVVAVRVYECDVISARLYRAFKAVEYRREEIVRQAALRLVREKNADIVGPVRLQRSCGGIREISHLPRDVPDVSLCLLTDILLIVKCLAHGRNAHAAGLGNVFH